MKITVSFLNGLVVIFISEFKNSKNNTKNKSQFDEIIYHIYNLFKCH